MACQQTGITHSLQLSHLMRAWFQLKASQSERGQVWLCFSEVKHLFRRCFASAPQNMLWFAGESDWRAARLVDFEMKRGPGVTQLGNGISTSCFRNISVSSNIRTVSFWTECYHSRDSVVTLLHFCSLWSLNMKSTFIWISSDSFYSLDNAQIVQCRLLLLLLFFFIGL